MRTLFFAGFIFLATINLIAQQKFGAPEVIHHRQDDGKYSIQSRKFTGISSMAVSSGGRLWVTWYAGITPAEDHNNYVVVSTSGDGGKTWEEVFVIDPDGEGPFRAYDSQIWLAPDNSLWLIWSQSIDKDFADLWIMKTDDPDKKDAVWTTPRFMTNGVMMNKPVVISTGEWLFPVALWNRPSTSELTNYSARVYVTTDKGENIRFLGASNIPTAERVFDEHMIVERKDGSLWMLARTRYGIGESFSNDKGKTWSEIQPSKILHPSSRFFISRLASGNLLLIKNGPVGVRTGRSHMMAFLSTDDGHTWSKGLLLDQGNNHRTRAGTISYPDGQQTIDGRIHITYDYSRTIDQLIFYIHFTEEDILDPIYDEAMVRVANNRIIVSKGGSGGSASNYNYF